MKTLVIVDVQHDFYSPSGSLYVPGGEEVIEPIKKLLESDKSIGQVIFTLDWHTPEDKSFKNNGGSWPVHCVQHSRGALLSQELLEAVWKRGFKSTDGKYNGEDLSRDFLYETYDVFLKGDTPDYEEYGAFDNSENLDDDVVDLFNISEDSHAYLNPDNDIIICGLAGDYCVLETAKNLLEIPEIHGEIKMFLPGIRSIDKGDKLKDWMSKIGIKEYNYGV